MIRFLAGVLLMVSTLTLAGCNTFAGFGEDIETGGRAIENAGNTR